MRYLIEDEYKRRNDEDQDNHLRIMKNHVHDGRILEEKSKEFDIINSKNVYSSDRTEKLFGKAPSISTWQKISQARPKIKSGGFE